MMSRCRAELIETFPAKIRRRVNARVQGCEGEALSDCRVAAEIDEETGEASARVWGRGERRLSPWLASEAP